MKQKRGNTPVRTVRIDDDLWDELKAVADQRDTTRSLVIKTALKTVVLKAKRTARAALRGPQ